jgi:hypothetical protein
MPSCRMYRMVIYKLFARIVWTSNSLTLRIPIDDFKGVAIQSWSFQKGYLVIEMTGKPVPKPLEEFSCRNC